MTSIERYVIVGEDDQPIDSVVYDTMHEAIAAAPTDEPVAVIAYEYEYAGSELVWSSTGEDFWPPPAESEAER